VAVVIIGKDLLLFLRCKRSRRQLRRALYAAELRPRDFVFGQSFFLIGLRLDHVLASEKDEQPTRAASDVQAPPRRTPEGRGEATNPREDNNKSSAARQSFRLRAICRG